MERVGDGVPRERNGPAHGVVIAAGVDQDAQGAVIPGLSEHGGEDVTLLLLWLRPGQTPFPGCTGVYTRHPRRDRRPPPCYGRRWR
jgi:hypothetical protein